MPTTDIAATGEEAEAPEEQRLGPFKCAAAAGAASAGRGDFSKDPVGPPPSGGLRGGGELSRDCRRELPRRRGSAAGGGASGGHASPRGAASAPFPQQKVVFLA